MSEENKESRLKFAETNAFILNQLHQKVNCTKAQADCIFEMESNMNEYLIRITETNK